LIFGATTQAHSVRYARVMRRPALVFPCLIGLACLVLAPTACSGTAGGGGSSASTSSGGTHVATAGSGGTTSTGGTAGAAGGSGGTLSTGGTPDYSASGASGTCDAVVQQHPLAEGIHVAGCSAIDYATNPPSSGEHYPIWADFGVYDFPLPRGYWVHNLEHGAVVVSYNCTTDCAADIAAAKAWLGKLTADIACPGPRILLVPDPKLDVAWAASSWGFTLRADCFDPDAFGDFYTKHEGQSLAPEASLCGTGEDFRLPDAETCGAK
jgi:Protein of unknown function (DUF3105)